MKIAIVQSGSPRVPDQSLPYLEKQVREIESRGHTVDVYATLWNDQQDHTEERDRVVQDIVHIDHAFSRLHTGTFHSNQNTLFAGAPFTDNTGNRARFGQLMGTILAHRNVPDLTAYDIVIRQRYDLVWELQGEALYDTWNFAVNTDRPAMFVAGMGLRPGRRPMCGDVLFWCNGRVAQQAYTGYDQWAYTQHELAAGTKDDGMHVRWIEFFLWRQLHIESIFLQGVKPIRTYLEKKG